VKSFSRVFTIEIQKGPIGKEENSRPDIKERVLFSGHKDEVGKKNNDYPWDEPMGKPSQKIREKL